ncbi:hypothetical protein D3C76_1260330 [compost metagenome]
MFVGAAQIFRQPAIHRRLVESARGAGHRGHDRQQRGQHQHDQHNVGHHLAAADAVRHDLAHAHATVDRGRQQAAVDRRSDHRATAIEHGRRHQLAQAQAALERQGHQGEHQDAQQAGIEDRLEGVALGVLEFAGVTHRRFETVGRPRGHEQPAGHQRPS